jgi:hypothetical protein
MEIHKYFGYLWVRVLQCMSLSNLYLFNTFLGNSSVLTFNRTITEEWLRAVMYKLC